jgi:DNA-binding NarL/FixJ family response regulator
MNGTQAIAIVDDHPITRAGLATYLSREGFEVRVAASAVEQVRCSADVVVCDLRLPGRSGPDAVAYLAERGHRVLATSGVARQEEILDTVAFGACGFVAKTAAPAMFARAVREVVTMSFYLCAELASLMLADAELRPLRTGEIGSTERAVLRLFAQGESAYEVAAGLGIPARALAELLSSIWTAAVARRSKLRPSPRERQLMQLIAQGCTHQEVAAQMTITSLTVSCYLKTVKEKYLASHPDVAKSVSPATAARKWAGEFGLT